MSAEVGAEGPLTNPDVVLDLVSLSRVLFILIAELLHSGIALVPGLVVVMVKYDVLGIIKQIVPVLRDQRQVDSMIMEDKLSSRSSNNLNQSANCLVEVFEIVEVGEFPWLVDGLECAKSVMLSPFLEDSDADPYGSFDVIGIHFVILFGGQVPVAEPVGCSSWPVLKMRLIDPVHLSRFTAVVKSILAMLPGVHFHPDLDSMLFACIKHPGDFVFGAIHAADEWSVWLEGPVTDWQSDH